MCLTDKGEKSLFERHSIKKMQKVLEEDAYNSKIKIFIIYLDWATDCRASKVKLANLQ